MYKMKDVCKITGLTEKAVRLYVEQSLVEPKIEQGIYRNTYSFEEKDIKRLKDIIILRNAGFALADMKRMFENPTDISSLIEEKDTLLAAEVKKKEALQKIINNLTIEEHSDVTKLADAIEPRSPQAKETPRMSRKIRRLIVCVILFVILCIPVMIEGKMMLQVYAGGLGTSLGILALIAGLRYLAYGRKGRKCSQRGTGTIVSVVTSDRIEDYVMNEEEKNAHDFAKLLFFGIGGMAIWESIRFDCWYPVIRYKDQNGKNQIGTIRYGAFKRTWKIGDEIDIAWDTGKEKLVYECKKKGIRQKAWSYLILAIIMLAVGASFWIAQFNRIGILESDVTPPNEEEARALTTEENKKLLDIVETLWVVEEMERSFVSSKLSNTEVLNMAYKMTVDVVYQNNVSAFQGTVLEEVALECFGYKLKVEDKIYCECGEVLAKYDGHTMVKIDMDHIHKVSEEKVEMIYEYEDSYYEDGHYVIELYKAPKSSPEEKIHCSYAFARDEKEENVLGMQDFEYYLVSYNQM